MAAPITVPLSAREPTPVAPALADLSTQTRATAARVYDAVAQQYLEFRRVYYHEDHPSLATVPPAHAEIRQAEVAMVAESTLKLLPQAVTSLPVLGGLIEHLEQVANIHSISERERTSLHNMAMTFLYGVRDGIQPWYVQWLLATAHNLGGVTEPEYYITFPWDALFYERPDEVAALDAAVRTGNVPAIEREIEHLADRLIAALRDPVGIQPELAFTGPDGEHRRRLFALKTALALGLAAYLVAEEARALLRPRARPHAPQSALAPFPPEITAHVVREGEVVH
jgi:hypothetical protein